MIFMVVLWSPAFGLTLDMHLRFNARYRHFLAAGGCICQARDAFLASRILQSIEAPTEPNLSATGLSVVLNDIGKLQVDSIDAIRSMDEASWPFWFKRNVRGGRTVPPPPSERFYICTTGLSMVLSDIGKLRVNSISAIRSIDEASWLFLFKRKDFGAILVAMGGKMSQVGTKIQKKRVPKRAD